MSSQVRVADGSQTLDDLRTQCGKPAPKNWAEEVTRKEDPKDRKDRAEEVTGKIQRTGRTVKRRSLGRSNGHEGGAAMLRRQ